MEIQKVAKTDFVLLHAVWSVEKGRQLIEALQPSHVIVYRRDPQVYYYLFTAEEALRYLAQAPDAPSMHEALQLHEYTATSVLESDTDAKHAPARCIILKDNYPLGFKDALFSPQLPLRGTDFESILSDHSDRSLVVELPEEVILNNAFSLEVYLSASLEPEAGSAFAFSRPVGTTIDIFVQPKRGIALEGDDQGQLVLSDEEETKHLEFRLRGTASGIGKLSVKAFHGAQPLGSLIISVNVLEASTTTGAQLRSREGSLAQVSHQQPDLLLEIIERSEAGKPTLTYKLKALDPALELYHKPFGPISLKVDAAQYFRNFFQGIDNIRPDGSTELRLAAKGTHLFTSLFPLELQDKLWSLQGHIKTVQVLSEEPWIPWELCMLCKRENHAVTPVSFFCEAYAITRWLDGGSYPHKNFPLKNIAIVVPDSGLRSAPDERDYLLSLSDSRRKVDLIPATYAELYKALASGKYDGWHFCGHGSFNEADPDDSILYLENRERFAPIDLCGVAAPMGKSSPVVFLNACQIGRSAMSLTTIGGWAGQFLRAGAGAFIGTYWSIYDKLAFKFAKALYTNLLAGQPVGEAVQTARATIRQGGDPTWLAYTVFADPLATVQQ